MDLYLLFALILIAIWLVTFLVYIAVSNRQRDIEGEIVAVERLLEQGEQEQG